MQSIINRVFLTAALPFVLAATYTSYRALWFTFFAAQAAGTVVEIVGTPPSLLVAYQTRDGEARTIESAGSDFYADVAVGTPITVFYDADDPGDARIDRCVEIWVVPLMLGSVCAVLLLAFLFARRGQPAHMDGRVVAYPFAAIGVGLLLFAAYLFNADRQLREHGETAVGTVVDFRLTKTRRLRTGLSSQPERFVYFREPIIEFTTRGGEPIRVVALSGSYPADLSTGDALDVLYLPDAPKRAELRDSQRLIGGAQIVTVLGATSFAVGVGMLVVPAWRRRARRQSAQRLR